MTSLTTYFPPVTAGDFYTPAMMEYDGSTGYYSSTITTSGNKITLIARFKILPETGNGYQTIAWCAGSTPRTRLAFYAGDTDIADTTHRNKLVMYGTDSSGTVTCRLVSTIDVNDGNTYTAFGSYDGDTGAATFYINGADVDDVGTGGRVLTTGTLEAGASSVFYTGAAGSANWKNGGEIGYVGMAEVYLTNWSDFMDPQGNPKDIEDNLGTVWGGTPLFWNQYGDMENNLGSAGAMTRNGTIVVSDDGTTGSSYALSATAIASDIASGKTAWVNGQKVTGTLDTVPLDSWNGILLQHENPLGLSDSSYLATTGDGNLILNSGITGLGAATWTLQTDGYAYNNSTWGSYWAGVLPTKTTTIRKAEVWGRTADFPLTTAMGVRIIFGITNKWTDYWTLHLTFNGTEYFLDMIQVVASGGISRANAVISSTVDGPAYYHMTLYDIGDGVVATLTMYESDVITDDDSVSIAYTVGSRVGKDNQEYQFTPVDNPGNEWFIKGIKITDI